MVPGPAHYIYVEPNNPQLRVLHPTLRDTSIDHYRIFHCNSMAYTEVQAVYVPALPWPTTDSIQTATAEVTTCSMLLIIKKHVWLCALLVNTSFYFIFVGPA